MDEIRHKYGNSNVELVYTSESALESSEGLYTVLSDDDQTGRRTAVLALEQDVTTNQALAYIISQDVMIHSFKELIPRMNDIFIKLVTQK